MRVIIYTFQRFKVPDWANWIATNRNGEVWVFENKPTDYEVSWQCGYPKYLAGTQSPQLWGVVWRNTLQEINTLPEYKDKENND